MRSCVLEEAQKKAEAVFFWKAEHLSSLESTKGMGEATRRDRQVNTGAP